MERRSTRGRVSSSDQQEVVVAHKSSAPKEKEKEKDKELVSSTTGPPKIIRVVPVPDKSDKHKNEYLKAKAALEEGRAADEEIKLNRRGTPARQRKRNRFYFDDENLVTAENFRKNYKSSATTPKIKIKQEPIEPEEIAGVEEVVTSTNEVEIPLPSPPPAPVRKPGRPPGSGKSQEKVKSQGKKSSDKNIIKRDHVPPVKIKIEPGSPSVKSAGKQEMREKERMERDNKETIVKEKRDKYVKEKERDDKKKEREQRQKKPRERDRDFIPTPERRQARVRRASSPTQSAAYQLLAAQSHIDIPLEPQKAPIDKKIAQDISIRLRNLLKLPKAHKWVCYEWFYSNIDKVLFEGENDFQICLKESFPQLKARKLTRVEWCKIRRLMGKPRRCSNAFFEEERDELARRRQKIRMIQQRKATDFNYKELPDEIPLQLVIGTKVTARLRRPQDGLFTGTIEGVDTSNNTYRITFDRNGLGTHSIPDFEVLSNDSPETVSTSSFALKIPRRSFQFGTQAYKFQNTLYDDGIFTSFPKSPFPVDGMLGGFPIRLLDMIVRLSKLLKSKREKILHLKELNVEAEKLRSYSKKLNDDYRIRYAKCVLDLDSMNKEMAAYLEVIQQYCLEIAPDHGSNQMIVPEHVQETSKQEALLIVDTYNTKQNRNLVHGQTILGLIANLTSLLLQVKALSSGDRNLYELKSIKDTMKDIKASLEGRNVQLFQDRVEIPMNRIQAGLCMSLPNKTAF